MKITIPELKRQDQAEFILDLRYLSVNNSIERFNTLNFLRQFDSRIPMVPKSATVSRSRNEICNALAIIYKTNFQSIKKFADSIYNILSIPSVETYDRAGLGFKIDYTNLSAKSIQIIGTPSIGCELNINSLLESEMLCRFYLESKGILSLDNLDMFKIMLKIYFSNFKEIYTGYDLFSCLSFPRYRCYFTLTGQHRVTLLISHIPNPSLKQYKKMLSITKLDSSSTINQNELITKIQESNP